MFGEGFWRDVEDEKGDGEQNGGEGTLVLEATESHCHDDIEDAHKKGCEKHEGEF